MDIGATLKPSSKTAEAMEPCIGSLDDPAHFAKTAPLEATFVVIEEVKTQNWTSCTYIRRQRGTTST